MANPGVGDDYWGLLGQEAPTTTEPLAMIKARDIPRSNSRHSVADSVAGEPTKHNGLAPCES